MSGPPLSPRTPGGRAGRRVQAFCRRQNLAAGGIDFRRGFKKSGVPADPVRGAAAKMLEFELAASLRDQIIELRGK
ncbi:MAG: UvrB/UvrC motif-containing protein [Lawsonibacter sp.]|nr:UvrB/UvrC motif-containing protein [Oscillospiraceae bacterium]